MTRRRRVAWMLMLAADVGLLAWGAMAALAPEYLAGPHGAPILPAGYEGYTQGSWQALRTSAAPTAGYIAVLFRVYAAYVVAFGLLAAFVAATAFRRGDRWSWWALAATNPLAYGSAMAYDWTVGAIGPFELSEYLGLAAVLAALVLTAPFVANREEAPWPRSSSAHT